MINLIPLKNNQKIFKQFKNKKLRSHRYKSPRPVPTAKKKLFKKNLKEKKNLKQKYLLNVYQFFCKKMKYYNKSKIIKLQLYKEIQDVVNQLKSVNIFINNKTHAKLYVRNQEELLLSAQLKEYLTS